MKKIIVLTFVVAFFFALSASDILACSCIQPKSAEKAFEQSFAVFSGKVLSVTKTGGGIKAKIRVEKTWKGSLPKVVTIRGGGMCGFTFAVGKKYLVYSSGKNNASLYAHLCSGTKLFSDAAEDAAALDKLKSE